ncbi:MULTISPECIES: Sec-independent protein translocase protein TatB [Hyphomicrobium]|jgi:sec-independent protein translocase protein TatB|uniref:Sec-independent protein translocase protein TatB n=1 Tax=Hyphomicrobium TaxID=81 RepID=UPI00036E5016|nr:MULTISPECIES: Sec-independent protein translocase protein TatB [Hyphomicrobium]WBT38424.1 Sec-independent protein translocase protein TatB [Hyphomicrobium sp. DMF-1]HML42661.1 Sec-independent protein translocase protein TatB [Hyphomicrobium zavarzinii]
MFEIGWSEILIVALVALVVVGPKDLPVLLRTIGRYAGMAKRTVASLREQIDATVREADLDLVRKEMQALENAAARDLGPGRVPARPMERKPASSGDAS